MVTSAQARAATVAIVYPKKAHKLQVIVNKTAVTFCFYF